MQLENLSVGNVFTEFAYFLNTNSLIKKFSTHHADNLPCAFKNLIYFSFNKILIILQITVENLSMQNGENFYKIILIARPLFYIKLYLRNIFI